jgi:crossover junction endodeoxyribonuclease RuvC
VRIVGIDPGVTGAAALFSPGSTPASGLRWQVVDLPVVGDPKRELNALALRDWLMKFSPDHAFLELISAMPSIPDARGIRRSMGAAGACRFCGMFYAIKAVLACCEVPFTLVAPGRWKKHHGLVGPDKERSRALALRLFPDQGFTLARKKDQNRAEAMLIAAYGARVTVEAE